MDSNEAALLREDLLKWAYQTIYYTISLRDIPEGKHIDLTERVTLAHGEAKVIFDEFLAETKVECENTPPLFLQMFVGRVLRWVAAQIAC